MLWWPQWWCDGSSLPGCIFWVINAVPLQSRSPIPNSGVNHKQSELGYSQPLLWKYCNLSVFTLSTSLSSPSQEERLCLNYQIWTTAVKLPKMHSSIRALSHLNFHLRENNYQYSNNGSRLLSHSRTHVIHSVGKFIWVIIYLLYILKV